MTTAELDRKVRGETPWAPRPRSWHGHLRGVDGASAADFTEEDVAEVIAAGCTGEGWDGEVAAVLRLHDGRFVAYESWWGPTGSGFCRDAYGGQADVIFAPSLDSAIRWGMTEDGRRLCGLPEPRP